MKKIYYFLFILSLTVELSGQIKPENLMTRKYISCQDIFYNITYLVPELYQRGSKDTLAAVIDYWEKSCGASESLIRCKILFSIEDNSFTEDLYDNSIISYLLSYKDGFIEGSNNYQTFGSSVWNNYSTSFNLNLFTIKLAKQLILRDDLTNVEMFFLQFYSKDFGSTFSLLNTKEFDGTKIQDYYFNEIKKYKKEVIAHGDLFSGIWIPTNKLELIGVHPVFGFRSGFIIKKLYADFNLSFRAGKSPNIYQVEENDSIWNTNHYFGGYIGFDFGYNLFSIGKNNFDLISGIAFDGFDALSIKTPNSNNDISKSLNSLNLNLGLGYKYFYNSLNYLGIDLKYNFVNYKNTHGTDLTGNTITINLIFGFLGSRFNDNRLQQLNYK